LKIASKLNPPEAPQFELGEGTHCVKETLPVSAGQTEFVVA
jgi:hypothetical protein